VRLTPELARLSRSYEHVMRDLKPATERNLSILVMRLMQKRSQVEQRIATLLVRQGLSEDTAAQWVSEMEATWLKENDQ
jgi:hypothetical protein